MLQYLCVEKSSSWESWYKRHRWYLPTSKHIPRTTILASMDKVQRKYVFVKDATFATQLFKPLKRQLPIHIRLLKGYTKKDIHIPTAPPVLMSLYQEQRKKHYSAIDRTARIFEGYKLFQSASTSHLFINRGCGYVKFRHKFRNFITFFPNASKLLFSLVTFILFF